MNNNNNMKYNYFVSYFCNDINKQEVGMTYIELKYPIRKFEDINLLKDIIKGKTKNDIVILNYILLDE